MKFMPATIFGLNGGLQNHVGPHLRVNKLSFPSPPPSPSPPVLLSEGSKFKTISNQMLIFIRGVNLISEVK